MSSSNSQALWYCSIDGDENGPLTAQQLKAWAAIGKLSEHHVVWKAGTNARYPAHKVKGLFDARRQPVRVAASDQALPEAPVESSDRDVFISYSNQDKPAADAICATLERDKVRCWIAPRDVFPGMSYGEAIIDAISVSRLMVVVLSAHSNGSPQVLREVERAVHKGIPIVPFRIENVKPSKSMEYFLSATHWMDAFTKPLEAHIERLSLLVRAVMKPGSQSLPILSVEPLNTSANRYKRQARVLVSRAQSAFAGLQRQVARVPRRILIPSAAAALLLVVSTVVAILTWPGPLDAEYRLYREAVSTGRGSIAFLKKAAPSRYTTWLARAEIGDSIGELFIGRCYQEGLVVKDNAAVALTWLEKSAKHSNSYAMHTLGLAHDLGQGVDVSRAEAVRWYTMAAEQGNSSSMVALGQLYATGVGLQPDPELAAKWYRQAADAGNAMGMRKMAECCLWGKGLSKDLAASDRWYQLAAKADDAEAIGMLLAKRLAAPLGAYLETGASDAVRSTSLATLRNLQAEYQALDLAGVGAVFDCSDFIVAAGGLAALKEDDPARAVYDGMVEQYIKLYGPASKSERTQSINGFSTATDSLVTRWFEKLRYDNICDFWDRSYKDILVSKFKDQGERSALIRQARMCIASRLRTSQNKEAKELLKETLELCDWILAERPWDWYVKDASMGLCADVAATLAEMQDTEQVQPLLKRAWTIRAKQYGQEEIVERYPELPLSGDVPAGATDDDRAFFEQFGKKKSEEEKKKSGMVRFTIPCKFGEQSYPFHVYVITGRRGYSELLDQFRWLLEMRGGQVPQEVRDSFARLNKIAVENKVDFMGLCEYALGMASKDTKTDETKEGDGNKDSK